MEWFSGAANLFLHMDVHLAGAIARYGVWTYALLFIIVFCETGLVITPFLPGDSLLFAAGSLAALGDFSVWRLVATFIAAAFLGDVTNYGVGRFLGTRLFRENSRLFKRKHLEQTHLFYEKHGSKALIMARFVPIVRTFAPFVAGLGRMRYVRFLSFSVIASLLWVSVCVGAGYLFGNIPVVKRNFSAVILGIIVISLLPVVVGRLRSKKTRSPLKPR
jgi:membrane-associated protein